MAKQPSGHGVFHADIVEHSPTYFARGNAFEQMVHYPIPDTRYQQARNVSLRTYSDTAKQPSPSYPDRSPHRTEQLHGATRGSAALARGPAFFLQPRPRSGPYSPAPPVFTARGTQQLAFNAAATLHDIPPREAPRQPAPLSGQRPNDGRYDHWRSHYGRSVRRPSTTSLGFVAAAQHQDRRQCQHQRQRQAISTLPRGAARRHHTTRRIEALLEASRAAREAGERVTPRHMHSVVEKREWERERERNYAAAARREEEKEELRHLQQREAAVALQQQQPKQQQQQQQKGSWNSGEPSWQQQGSSRDGYRCNGYSFQLGSRDGLAVRSPSSRPGSRDSNGASSRQNYRRSRKPAGLRTGRPYTASSVTSSSSRFSASSECKDRIISALRMELATLCTQFKKQEQRSC